MADQKETFTATEYSAWRKVNRIMAENNVEPEQEPTRSSETDKKKPVFDDPRDAYMADQKRIREERERRPNYNDEEKAMIKEAVKRIDY